MENTKNVQDLVDLIVNDVNIVNSIEATKKLIRDGKERLIDKDAINKLNVVKNRYKRLIINLLNKLQMDIKNDFNIEFNGDIDSDIDVYSIRLEIIPSILSAIIQGRINNDNPAHIDGYIRQLREILYIYRLQVSNM